MTFSAEALDFESAARLRDQVVRLRSQIESTPEDEVLERLKRGARKGSAHGVKKRRR
jgi:excinuclease ABC subunit B